MKKKLPSLLECSKRPSVAEFANLSKPPSPEELDALTRLKQIVPLMNNWAYSADTEYRERLKADLLKKFGSEDSFEYRTAIANSDPYWLRRNTSAAANRLAIAQSLKEFEALYLKFQCEILRDQKDNIPNSIDQFFGMLKNQGVLTIDEYYKQVKETNKFVKFSVFGVAALGTMITLHQQQKLSEPQRRQNALPLLLAAPLTIEGFLALGTGAKIASILGVSALGYGTYLGTNALLREAQSLYYRKEDVIDVEVLNERRGMLEEMIDKNMTYPKDSIQGLTLEPYYPGTSMSLCSVSTAGTEAQAKYALTLATFITGDKTFLQKAKTLSFKKMKTAEVFEEMQSILSSFQQSPNAVLRSYSLYFSSLANAWCLEDSKSFLETLNQKDDGPLICKGESTLDHYVQVFEGLFAGGDIPCKYMYDKDKWKKMKIAVYAPLALGGLYLTLPFVLPVFNIATTLAGSVAKRAARSIEE